MRVVVVFALAASAALLAACDREAPRSTEPRAETPASAGASSVPPASAGASTPTTPANLGQPRTMEEKKESISPVQGQVDPKAQGQKEDFQQRGDSKGPKGEDTAPKRGG